MPESDPEGVRTEAEAGEPRHHHTCPVWIGRLLVSPLRRLVENPLEILAPLASRGSTVVDVGCAMGFHSLDLARLVGPDGRVVCVDLQQEMLEGLLKRARRKGVEAVIEPRLCTQNDLGLADLAGKAELVTAFHVVHETEFPDRFLRECAATLRPAGRLLVVEPRGHVDDRDFAATVAAVQGLGLARETAPKIRWSHTALFAKT